MPERVEYVYNALRQRTERRKGDPPHGLKLSKGSAHISARREFVEFAVNDRRAQDLLLWLRDTFAPDETFFNSLNRNPALKIPGTYLGKECWSSNWWDAANSTELILSMIMIMFE